MKRLLLIFALAVATLAATTPPAPAEPSAASLAAAGPFLRNEILQKVQGNYGAAWKTLYPGHQRIAPQDRYVACESATPFPAPLQHLTVTRVRAVLVNVPGAATALPGAAVTVRVVLGFMPRDPIEFTHTFHLVASGGRWTWILAGSSYAAYAVGRCP